MKKISLFVFFVIYFSSAYAQDSVKYFRRFYIDTRQYQYRTEVPISSEKAKHTFAYRVAYYKSGKIKDIRFLQAGMPVYDKTGFAGVVINYTDSTEKRTFIDHNNKPMKYNGVYSYSIFFDNERKPIKRINFDKKGLISQDVYGVAIYCWSLDEKGWIVSEKYLDANKNQMANKKGYFEEKYTWGEDAENYIMRIEFLDERQKPVENKSGFAARMITFDKKTESFREFRHYNLKNQLVEDKQGVAIAKASYDNDLNKISEMYFDKNNRLTENKNGVAIFEWEYDTLGNNTKLSYYNKKRELTPFKKTGFAQTTYKFNSLGKPLEICTYDKNNSLKENKKREAIIRWSYDEQGKLISIKGYNSKNQWVSEKYKSSE